MDLQWPHHGAKNLTKTVLPLVADSQVSGVSSIAPAPAKAPTSKMNFAMVTNNVAVPNASNN